ncbi:MAG: thiamine pyrophosphate-binding protein, partial [Acidobacteriota bacterium]|nr:thiamine pyrophosphate-binding protein [Acidobacteriota bacterium]
MTIADYIIETLSKRVSHAYGVYGAANAHLFDAIKRQLKLQMICTAGEQGAGFAAEGHAKATSGIGLCITTSGPGALNAATSVANCHYDSVPVLFLCGQVSTKVMRRDYSSLRQRGFQECAVVDVMKPISKYCREIREPHEVKEALDSALQMMTMGRPGPAVLSLPLDVLSAPVPAKWPAPFISETLPDNTPSPDVAQVHGCLTALRRAERPIILVGGGCRESASAVRRFAETVGVHVFRTWNALDIAPDDWPLYGGNVGTYGGKGRNFAVQQADFALVLGCRLSGRITGGATKSFLRGARAGEGIWHVDADYGVIEELEQDVPNRKKIRAYVDAFLRVAQESLG